MRCALTAVLAGLILTACVEPTADGPPETRTVPTDTIDGLVIVRNGPSGLWEEGDEWRLDEEMRIGSIDGDGPDVFGRINAVGIGPDGNTYVLDRQAADIRVFDRDGVFLRRAGGQGEGPGELSGPSGLAWDSFDRLWVPERGNSRYSVFDSTGAFLRTIPRRVRPWGDLQRWGYDEAGWFADEMFASPVSGRATRAFARVDTTGVILDSLFFLGDPFSLDFQSLARFPPELSPFATVPVFSLPRAGRVWFAKSDEYRLFQQDVTGDTLRIVETAHRHLALSTDEQTLIEELLGQADLSREAFPLGRQIVRAIHILEDGHLLVQIEEVTSQLGQEYWGRVFDVFDPEGRFLGTMRTEFLVDGQVTPSSRGGEIVFVTRGELDVTYAVRVSIRIGPRSAAVPRNLF